MDLKMIEKRAYEAFGTKSSHPYKETGNKYHHGLRIAKLALTLRGRVPGQVYWSSAAKEAGIFPASFAI